MKILFFPSDIGGGFGHISRCLALAHEATYKGHESSFVIHEKKYEKKISNDFNVSVVKKQIRLLSLLFLVKQRLFGKKPHLPRFLQTSPALITRF